MFIAWNIKSKNIIFSAMVEINFFVIFQSERHSLVECLRFPVVKLLCYVNLAVRSPLGNSPLVQYRSVLNRIEQFSVQHLYSSI